MVRTAITIISLLLSVVMPSLASTKNFEVTKAPKIGEDSILLYVSDIPLPDSVKIYGQPNFKQKDQYYGGKTKRLFTDNYTPVNNSVEGLTFDRDKNGIFFKIPARSDIDSVDITLVQAYYAGSTDGWCPKKNKEDYISVVWWLKEKSALDNANHKNEPVDSIPRNYSGGETSTAAPSPWHISHTDWVLFVLIVILALAVLFVKSKPKEKPDDKAKVAEDLKFEIANLKMQITDITTANNNSTRAISDLVRRYNTLESAMHKLQKKDRRANNDNSGENTQVFRPTPPAQPVNLGGAEPVAGEKALVINRTGALFFQLTRNIDGQVTFTLIDNPEVRNFFETNLSMLKIYKNNGIISYDNIPNNSHVYVESVGIAKETGLEKYEVVAPLKLIFK
ncbi:MAG: hypothetical protein HDS37_04710 [Bacteroides sp.]|nr:hypothetical protein [Bacteroides sp.]